MRCDAMAPGYGHEKKRKMRKTKKKKERKKYGEKLKKPKTEDQRSAKK
jgi:hypothetical protein